MNTIERMDEKAFENSFALAQYAFQLDTSETSKKRYAHLMAHSVTYGSVEDNQLASQVMMTPFQVSFFGKTFPMAGIGFVASDPAFRGQGNIDQLMSAMLKDCHEKKMLFSYLAPFSYPFYRRYGYELLFERAKLEISSHNGQDSPKVNGYIKRQQWPEIKEIVTKIYATSTKNKNGSLKREDWWYDYKFALKKAMEFAIYYTKEGKPAGYLAYTIENGCFICQEWICLLPEAYQGLNRYIYSHKDSTHKIIYEHGFDGHTNFFLQARPFEKLEVRPEMMVRIVDVKAFMEIFPWQNLQQSFAICIKEDKYAPWNEGTFEIHLHPNEIKQVEKTQLPTLTISMQQLTQLFLGYLSLEEVKFYENLEMSQELEENVKAILPSQKPILEDYF